MRKILFLFIGILFLAGIAQAATYTSQYPPGYNTTYVKDANNNGAGYYSYLAFDPSRPLTGTYNGNSWLTSWQVSLTNRVNVDLGSGKVVTRVYYENGHNSGAETDKGVKDFTFWGSNTAGSFNNITYTNDTGWTQLTTAQSTFDQHSASNAADPKYILITNSDSYRYYSFKFSTNWGNGYKYENIRRIELQTTDPVYAPVASFNIQLIDTSTNTPASWAWNYTNLTGNNISTNFSVSQNPLLTLTTAGNYLISLVATNSGGGNTSTKTIGINLRNVQVYFWNRTA